MRNRSDAYVMLDVESSGTRLGYHDLIQFGAVAVYGPNLEFRRDFPVYRGRPDLAPNLIQPHFKGEPNPDSMRVHGISWDDITTFGEPPLVFVNRFYNWVREIRMEQGVDKVVLCGHGMTFDWSFTKLLYDQYRDDWPCHYSGLDFKSWYGGLRAVEYIDSSMTDMRREFGIGKNNAAHDAQADAEYQLTFMLRAMQRAGIIQLPPGSSQAPPAGHGAS